MPSFCPQCVAALAACGFLHRWEWEEEFPAVWIGGGWPHLAREEAIHSPQPISCFLSPSFHPFLSLARYSPSRRGKELGRVALYVRSRPGVTRFVRHVQPARHGSGLAGVVREARPHGLGFGRLRGPGLVDAYVW